MRRNQKLYKFIKINIIRIIALSVACESLIIELVKIVGSF